MEEIKFGKQISLFEFVTKGMIKSSKTIENFVSLHTIYNANKNKIIKYTSQRFIFDESEFSIAISRPEDYVKPPTKMKMCLIAAIGTQNELGTEGKLIWKIPEDMARFKELTMGHFILMGRKTFDSFGGRVLHKRHHIVVTRNVELLSNLDSPPRVTYVPDVATGIHFINKMAPDYVDLYNQERFYVIGGGEIYNQTIDEADELQLTCILNEIIDVPIDAYFPVVDMNKFQIHANHPREYYGVKYYFRYLIKHTNKVQEAPTLNKSIVNGLLVNYLTSNLR